MEQNRYPTIKEIEKEYKEWAVALLKVRHDLKPEAFDEHHKANFTYENTADCLWNKIECVIERGIEHRESLYKEQELTKELIDKLYKQCFDVLYLMLCVKASREELTGEGMACLSSMQHFGNDIESSYSIDDVDKRLNEMFDYINELRDI